MILKLLKRNKLNLNNSNYSKQTKSQKLLINSNYRFLVSGRLNGVRMARNFKNFTGRTRTQTLNSNSNFVSKNIYTK